LGRRIGSLVGSIVDFGSGGGSIKFAPKSVENFVHSAVLEFATQHGAGRVLIALEKTPERDGNSIGRFWRAPGFYELHIRAGDRSTGRDIVYRLHGRSSAIRFNLWHNTIPHFAGLSLRKR
jgi:hypothetical protein